MFTISCYTFHPIFARFITLYRHVQVFSAWLLCILSSLCCACFAVLPPEQGPRSELMQNSSMESVAMIVPKDFGRSKEMQSQHLVINFEPEAGDSEGGTRCQIITPGSKRNELEGLEVRLDEDGSSVSLLKTSSVSTEESDVNKNYPTIHRSKKFDKIEPNTSYLSSTPHNIFNL